MRSELIVYVFERPITARSRSARGPDEKGKTSRDVVSVGEKNDGPIDTRADERTRENEERAVQKISEQHRNPPGCSLFL